MSFDQAWLELMPHTVKVAKLTGRNGDGSPIFGPDVAYPARVGGASKMVYGPDGQIVVSAAVVWIAGTTGITVSDRLTLPDGTSDRPMLAVNTTADENGDLFDKVYLR